MASYKLNLARIQGCCGPAELAKRMEAWGMPEDQEFGVLNHSATEQAVFGTIVRRFQQTVQTVDADTREVTSQSVERVNLYPFGVKPSSEVLELYAGSASGIEQMGVFFASCLALNTVVESLELDVVAAVEKLSKSTQKFQLRSIRIKDYAHNSYMAGPYAPKFLDSQHGMDFLQEYADQVVSAGVAFAGPSGRVTASLTPRACLTFSCHEDDQAAVQSILRKLV